MFINCRQEGQGSTDEVRGKDFRRELEDKERAAREKRDKDRNRGYFISLFSVYGICSVSEIIGLVSDLSQFDTQNCLGCHSKLNLGSEFHAEVITHLPHIKLRTLYALNIIL